MTEPLPWYKRRRVHFEFIHELDAPLDAVELALLSPELGPMLGRTISNMESVQTAEHTLKDGELRRVLRFQASAPLPIFKNYPVAREALAWEEHSTYRLADHAATWVVLTKEEWRRHFRAQGTYKLEPMDGGRTRRIVRGELDINLKVLGRVVERMALIEVRKTYDAEAEALRRLTTI